MILSNYHARLCYPTEAADGEEPPPSGTGGSRDGSRGGCDRDLGTLLDVDEQPKREYLRGENTKVIKDSQALLSWIGQP